MEGDREEYEDDEEYEEDEEDEDEDGAGPASSLQTPPQAFSRTGNAGTSAQHAGRSEDPTRTASSSSNYNDARNGKKGRDKSRPTRRAAEPDGEVKVENEIETESEKKSKNEERAKKRSTKKQRKKKAQAKKVGNADSKIKEDDNTEANVPNAKRKKNTKQPKGKHSTQEVAGDTISIKTDSWAIIIDGNAVGVTDYGGPSWKGPIRYVRVDGIGNCILFAYQGTLNGRTMTRVYHLSPEVYQLKPRSAKPSKVCSIQNEIREFRRKVTNLRTFAVTNYAHKRDLKHSIRSVLRPELKLYNAQFPQNGVECADGTANFMVDTEEFGIYALSDAAPTLSKRELYGSEGPKLINTQPKDLLASAT